MIDIYKSKYSQRYEREEQFDMDIYDCCYIAVESIAAFRVISVQGVFLD